MKYDKNNECCEKFNQRNNVSFTCCRDIIRSSPHIFQLFCARRVTFLKEV